MKYVSMILAALLVAGGGLGYWYYNSSQNTISILTENNAKLENGIQLNEETINNLQISYTAAQEQIEQLNIENREIRRNNQMLIDRFSDSDIGVAAANKPELVERLINRGTNNAFRCLELLSGSELTERERNAKNGNEFNRECPWIFDSFNFP